MNESGGSTTTAKAGTGEEIVGGAVEGIGEGKQDVPARDAPGLLDSADGRLADAGDVGQLGLREAQPSATSGDGGGKDVGIDGAHISASCPEYASAAIPSGMKNDGAPSTQALAGLIGLAGTAAGAGSPLPTGRVMANSRRMPNGRHRYFCAQVKRRREALGFSQEELAKRAGVSQSTISRIESFDPRRTGWEKVAQIAHALECTPDDLTGPHIAVVGAQPGAPKPARRVRRVEMRDLMHDYSLSELMQEDQPTAEEMRWLAAQGVVTFVLDENTAAASNAELVHELLEGHRAGDL